MAMSKRLWEDDTTDPNLPSLVRKITACSACRRQKIKCLIDESGTPCRRCAKYRLQCVVNKNLQTIIDEKTQYIDAILKDLENTHILLRQLVQKLGLPDPKVLQTAALRKTLHSKPLRDADRGFENSNHHDDSGFSRDGSPEFSATEDPSLPHVPMQSLYALTKLKSLRSPGVLDQQHNQDTNDFTQRGAVSESEAERLFTQYRDGLDAFSTKSVAVMTP